MKVILSKQCLTLVGMLERGLGFHLQQRKNGFYAKRNSKGFVPPDGHWRFIVLCAEMARNRLYITDVRVYGVEMYEALFEAGLHTAALAISKKTYNAADIINFRRKYLLNQA